LTPSQLSEQSRSTNAICSNAASIKVLVDIADMLLQKLNADMPVPSIFHAKTSIELPD
jgi:hypothetical protein